MPRVRIGILWTMKRLLTLPSLILFVALTASTGAPTFGAPAPAESAMPEMSSMSMTSSTDLLSPMSAEGSGTSWLPASSPMYGKMVMKPNGDMLMVHGAIMPRYTDVGSRRGDRRFDAPNWAMGMFSRPLGTQAQLGLRVMGSLDPITEGGHGYPLLFQTGETWHGVPLHDRQHPHDLIDELSVTYSQRAGGNRSTYVYLAYPGEPALGPPTYMHRLIAYDLADAPIGHHWQDATHISFGVATAGYDFGGKAKLEVSSFTGREPDENRYSFDRPRFDSESARLSYSPDNSDAFQISYGAQNDPEGDGANVHRTTASWIYNRPLAGDSNLTTSLVWGRNDLDGQGITDSYLAEVDYQHGVNTLFSRIEQIHKSGTELVLPPPFDNATAYPLGAFTFGGIHDLSHGSGIDTGIGATVTIDTKPSTLDPFYGSGVPVSFEVFFRIRPSRIGGMRDEGVTGLATSPPQPSPSTQTVRSPPTLPAPVPTPSAPATAVPSPPTPAVPPPTPSAPVNPSPAPSQSSTSTAANPATPASPAAPPPATSPPAPSGSAAPAVTIARITAAISPSAPKAGAANRVVLSVTDAGGSPVLGAAIKASLAMTEMDMGTSHPAVKEIGNGQYAMSVTFAMNGTWRVTVSALMPGSTKPFIAKFDFAAGPP